MTLEMTAPLEVVRPRLTASQRARAATLTVFFIQGAVFSTWVSRIPVVQDRLHLSNSRLGLALLAISAAGMVAMPVTGVVAAKVGARRVLRVGMMIYCLTLLLPAVAGELWQLVLGLLAAGDDVWGDECGDEFAGGDGGEGLWAADHGVVSCAV